MALYGSTGLPIIVAVTSVAVSGGSMSQSNSSLLVAGGAVTVLLLPMIATLLDRSQPESRDVSPAVEVARSTFMSQVMSRSGS